MKNYICKKCGKPFQYHRKKKLCQDCKPKYTHYSTIEEREQAKKKRNIEGVNRRRIKIKNKIVHFCGDKCCICGYNKCDRSLQLHHIDPNAKELAIASHMTNTSWDRLKQEIQKCILVCANCHGEIHAGLYDEEFLQQKYLEVQEILTQNIKKENYEIQTRIEQKKEEKQVEQLEKNFSRRKVKRPSYEQFKKEFEELNGNYCAMGRKYGVSDNAIRKWIKDYEKN